MQATVQDQIQWLVRRNSPARHISGGEARAPSGVVVLGPFVTDQVRAMVEQGMLEADDELCPENSYWFALRETHEVKRFLGIENVVMARSGSGSDAESTQPDLETTAPDFLPSDDHTPPGLTPALMHDASQNSNPDATGVMTVRRPANAPAPKPAAAARSKNVIPQASSNKELSDRFQRVASPPSIAYSNPGAGAPASEQQSSSLGMEKGQILGLMIIIGLILAVIGVVWVIRSLRI